MYMFRGLPEGVRSRLALEGPKLGGDVRASGFVRMQRVLGDAPVSDSQEERFFFSLSAGELRARFLNWSGGAIRVRGGAGPIRRRGCGCREGDRVGGWVGLARTRWPRG